MSHSIIAQLLILGLLIYAAITFAILSLYRPRKITDNEILEQWKKSAISYSKSNTKKEKYIDNFNE